MAMQCNALKPEERGGEGGVMLALTPPSTEILCQSLHFPYMSIVFLSDNLLQFWEGRFNQIESEAAVTVHLHERAWRLQRAQ